MHVEGQLAQKPNGRQARRVVILLPSVETVKETLITKTQQNIQNPFYIARIFLGVLIVPASIFPHHNILQR